MRTIFTAIAMVAGLLPSWGQVSIERQVSASSGKSTFNGMLVVDWTLGETCVETYADNGGLMVSEGFHQVGLTATATSEGPLPYQVQVFPNPVSMTLYVSADASGSLTASLFSLDGKELSTANLGLPVERAAISMSSLPAATYVLVFKDQGGSSQAFKIQKI
jgi:hypothetical protein